MPDSQPIETRNGVSYATHDGVSLLGDLYLPAGAGPFPALVGVHGGGWQAGARNAFQFWGPYLAARGYALFAISYRLAKKGQKMFPQAVNDVLAAVQFVRGSAGELKIDPERIGLFGASAGGHLASLAALGGASFQGAYPNDAHAKVSSKVKALIGVYGVYDLVEMWQRYLLQSPRENNIENFMGASPMDDPKLYFEASSINYATFANNHIGVLLSVGTEDDLVDRRAHATPSSSGVPISPRAATGCSPSAIAWPRRARRCSRKPSTTCWRRCNSSAAAPASSRSIRSGSDCSALPPAAISPRWPRSAARASRAPIRTTRMPRSAAR